MSSKRRLAAIMFTDVEGYTSIMGQDETLAVRMLASHEEFLEALTKKYNGKVIQYYGDGSLSTFDSAQNAALCAKELQLALTGDHHVPLRIGLHVGEILEKEGKIFGDGVNVASRIESSGYAGTVLMSKDFYEKVKNTPALDFKALGRFSFKNVADTMDLYALTGDSLAPINTKRLRNRAPLVASSPTRWWPYALGGAMIVAILLMVSAFIENRGARPVNDPSSGELQKVAIFPFDIKASPELAYLSEGLVDVFSTKIDGISGYNAIDPNLVIGSTRGDNSQKTTPKEYASLARELGAGQFFLGNLTAFGDDIRIKVSQYNSRGEAINGAEVVIHQLDSLLEAVDVLTRKTIATKYLESKQDIAAAQVLFSQDLQALTFFLQGEEKRRSGKILEAYQLYTNAVSIDSTMALAWLRMWQVCSWNTICPQSGRYFMDNAVKYRSNLPPKMAEYIEAAFIKGGFWGSEERLQAFKDLVRKYGETTEFLVGLGEAIFHAPVNEKNTPLDALPYFLKAFEMDPGNTEVVNHVGQLLAFTGDTLSIHQIRDQLPENSDNRLVFSVIYLLSSQKEWTDEDVLAILKDPSFDIENIFIRARADRYLARFVRLLRDMYRLSDTPIPSPNVPVRQLLLSYTGEDVSYFLENKNQLLEMAGTGLFQAYNVEPDRNFGNKYLGDPNDYFTSGIRGEGFFPGDFALMMHDLANKDFSSFQTHYAALKKLSGVSKDYERCLKLSRAFFYRKKGAFEKSNQILDSVLYSYDPGLYRMGNSFVTGLAEYAIAENLISLRQYKQAYYNLNSQFMVLGVGDDALVAHSLLLRAEVCQKLGRGTEALDLVNQFLELFQNCHPDYTPWVNRALKVREWVINERQTPEL